jgi:hypothetical protein
MPFSGLITPKSGTLAAGLAAEQRNRCVGIVHWCFQRLLAALSDAYLALHRAELLCAA